MNIFDALYPNYLKPSFAGSLGINYWDISGL